MKITNTASKALRNIEKRSLKALSAYADAAGMKMAKEAKRTHPWTNRSKLAETTIGHETEEAGSRVRIHLTSGVKYGVYLEYVQFKHKGRLSVFWPTVKKMAPEILRAWAERVR